MSFSTLCRTFLTLGLALATLCLASITWAIPPLHEAARDGKIDEVRRLLAEDPAKRMEADESGNNAIHWAIATGQTAVVEELLRRGVPVNIAKTDAAKASNQVGWTPLHQAAAGGQVECLKILMRFRPNLNARDANDMSSLHTAAWHNQEAAAKFLIDAGTPVNITRKDKVIPLEIASFFGHIAVVKMLIANGADVHWRVYDGNTCLHQAARNGQWAAMQALVEAGADIEAKRDDGQTALHIAASSGQVVATTFLLTMGANVNAQTNDGVTPLATAQRANQGATAAILQNYLTAAKEVETLMAARKRNAAELAGAKIGRETTVYKSEFDEEVPGDEWSSTVTGAFSGPLKTTPIPNTGKRFLGEFGDQNIRLTLAKLPPHAEVTVVLTLFILNTWDGGGILPGAGPDIFEASVEGGPTLLRATFANIAPEWKHTPQQSFPGDFTMEAHIAREGAIASDILHLAATKENPAGKSDSVYRLKFTFAHNKPLLLLNFQGKNLQELADESWGIRNIEVRVAGNAKSLTKRSRKKISR